MTSNKKAFEEFTDINISSAAKVIQDEHQDMGQDYGKILALQLDDITKKDLELSVLKSKFFNASIYYDTNIVDEEKLIEFGNIQGLWYRDKTGYSFFGRTINSRDNITAKIDTTKMEAKFQYLSD